MSTITAANENAIDVKKAVQIANASVVDLFGQDMENVPPRLEEVELSDDGKIWLITVSFLRKLPAHVNTMGDIARSLTAQRDYKRVKLNAEDGSVLAVNIRSL